jgi:hypothetical protein
MKKVPVKNGLSLSVVILTILSVLWSCGGPDEPEVSREPEEAPQAVIQEEELDTIALPTIDHALVTFLTGDAYITDGDDPEGDVADIGSLLGQGQQLEVDSGYVELQIGDIGTVRVTEQSKIQLDDIVLSSAGSSVDLRVVSGSILNKVERLAGNDTYEVRTETAVMGVRGTQFGVNVGADGGTRVAVREGRVAMVPPAADPERVRRRAATSGEAAEAVEAIAVTMTENAPVIEANQEVSMDRASAEEAEVAAAEIENTITEIESRAAAGETVNFEEVSARLATAAAQTTERARETTEQRRTEVSEESRVELEQIEQIRYIPIPPPPAEPEVDEDGQETADQPAPAPVQVLVPVRLRVEPAGAQIMIDGRPVARDRFSGVYQPGERLRFELTLDGYQTETLDVTVDPDRGRAYQVQLAQVPRRPETAELSVTVQPRQARISINGSRGGSGSVTESFEVGREVTVRAEMDGYVTEERTVTISSDLAPVRFELARASAGISIEAEPSDAVILINGEEAGSGSVTAEYPQGERLEVSVSREGYRTAERAVTVGDTAQPVRFQLEQIMGTVAISAEPTDARILIDGAQAGTGSVSREFPAGTQLTVEIERADYATLSVPVTVQEGTNNLNYELSRELGRLSVTATPSTARILINGTEMGTGQVTQDLPAGQSATVSAVQDGYVTQERTVQVSTGTTPLRFSLERGAAQLSVTVQPTDARIAINGRDAGAGSTSRSVTTGDTVRVTATRPGYAPAERSVQVGPAGQTLELRLEPRPVEQTINAGASGWVRGFVSDGTRVYGADTAGTVYAVDPAGRVVWQQNTGNSGNENSIPVVANGRVVFSGAAELVVLSATDGRVLNRRALSGPESHLFGRRVTSRSGGWYLPTDEALLLLNTDGADAGRRISLPGGSKMSVAVAGNRLVTADQQGEVLILDASSGNVEATVNTGMTQPVALAPAVAGDVAYFVGRRGTAVAVNVATESTVWETALPGGRGSFIDPLVAGNVLYILDRSDLIALSLRDGSVQYTIRNVAGMPAVIGETTYVVLEDGELQRVQTSTGRVLGTLRLPAGGAGGITAVGQRLAVGLQDGRIVIVHPDGM